MTYVKLISETEIEIAPKNKGPILNYDLDIEQMIKDGYKLLIEVERPETVRKYEITYTESIDSVNEVITWTETEEECQKRIEKEAKERIGKLKCTKRVLALILEEGGISYYDTLLPLINANPKAKLEWELCVDLERKNPLIDAIGEQLGLSSSQIDSIFLKANMSEV